MMKIGAEVKALGRKFCAVRQLSAIHRFFSAGCRVSHYGRVFSARSHSAPRFLLRRKKNLPLLAPGVLLVLPEMAFSLFWPYEPASFLIYPEWYCCK